MRIRETPFILWLLGVGASLLFIGVAAALYGPSILLFSGAVALVIFLSYWLDLGIYVMVFLAPMIGWEFRADSFTSLIGSSLAGFHVPMVDLWTILLLIAYGVYLIRKWLVGEKHRINVPGLGLYSLFLASAVFSLMNAHPWELSSSIGYIVRFPLFMYLGYVVLGTNIIRHKFTLDQALKIYAWVAFFGACMGLLSLVLGVYGLGGLHRAVPFAIYGWQPFSYGSIGYGHILMAEMLTTALPVMVYLAYRGENAYHMFKYICMSIFTGVICLLTFSRAGWVTLFLQVGVFLYLVRGSINWKKVKKFIPALVIAFIPFAAYMALFLKSGIVSSSNSARIALTDIGWNLFLEHPILGQGIGTFIDRLRETYYFIYEFGDPIEAHSIVTKIMAEQGMLGIVTFTLFIGWILRSFYIRMTREQYSIDARIAAFLSFFLVLSPLIFQLFNTQYYSARMWVPIMLALSINLLYRDEKEFPLFYTHFRPDKYKIETDIT